MTFPNPPDPARELFDRIFPVGHVLIRTDAVDPATLYGGAWAQFGAGRVLVGQDVGQAEFDTLGEAGGAKTVTLTGAQLPAHSHTVTDPGHTHVQNAHAHGEQLQGGTTGTTTGAHLMGSAATGGSLRTAGQSTLNQTAVNQTATTGVTVNGGGGGLAHENLPPYLVVRFWQRTA